MSWATLVQPLRDVPGVLGFVLSDQDGRIVARDLNTHYDETILARVAMRVASLTEASQEEIGTAFAWTLRFESHVIAVRREREHSLICLTTLGANLSALSVAGRLLLRRVGAAPRLPTPPPAPTRRRSVITPPPMTAVRPPSPLSVEPGSLRPTTVDPSVPPKSSKKPSAARRKKLNRKKKGIWG